MTFIDRIADARDIAELFDLASEFIGDLQRMAESGRTNAADDVAYCLPMVSREISADCTDDEIAAMSSRARLAGPYERVSPILLDIEATRPDHGQAAAPLRTTRRSSTGSLTPVTSQSCLSW